MKTTSTAVRSRAAAGGPLAATTVRCILPVKDMGRARRFYAKWGFREVGESDYVLGDDIQRDLLLTIGLPAADPAR